MIVDAAFHAFRQVLSPPFRSVLWKSLALTIGLLLLVWAALTKLFSSWFAGTAAVAQYPWIDAYAVLLAGFGLVIGLAYLIPPVSILVAGFFLDDVAEKVERADYPQDEPGRALPVSTALIEAARFGLTALAVNLLALLFFFIPVLNVVIFFGANAYLLGREYFTLAAGRFRPLSEARAMRVRNAPMVLLAGCLLAGMVAVPVLNLLTPLFGTALMVHLHKRLSAREQRAGLPGGRQA
jgi:CysZ protein